MKIQILTSGKFQMIAFFEIQWTAVVLVEDQESLNQSLKVEILQIFFYMFFADAVENLSKA